MRAFVVRGAALDPALLGALALGSVLCLYGIHWGVAEPWNPDQMAYYDALTDEGRLTLHPGNFLKPPFHKYLSLALARLPAYAVSELLGASEIGRHKLTLIWARLLTVALFLLQVALVHAITRRFFGRFAARILALAYGTSAGIIAFSHFLTADIPLTTWMLAAFYFAQNVLLRGRLLDYVLAGALTGIAAATKYNGLAIGIALVVAHALTLDPRAWARGALDARLLLGIAAVPLAFVIANPFSILDAGAFTSDFMYNLITTPVYGGESSGNSYLEYWRHVIEVIGWPAFVLLVAAVTGGIWSIIGRGRPDRLELQGVLLLLSISLPYYAYFGSFARLETRFVLPVVPYLMMLAGPACAQLRPRFRMVAAVLGLLLLYNAASSAMVGWRFANDPRMATRAWLREEAPRGAVVEYSPYAPRPDLIEDAGFTAVRMPFDSGRRQAFADMFAGSDWVRANLDQVERSGGNWYCPDALARRAPDLVVIDSLYFGRFLEGRTVGAAECDIGQFFTDLLEGRLGYRVVFDRTSQDVPSWAYPRAIDFLHNRIVVLERSREAPPAGTD
jgi:hypothetical protein